MKFIFASGAKHAQPGLLEPVYCRAFQVSLRWIPESWAIFIFIFVFVVGGALLAACAAGQVANTETGPALVNEASAVSQGPIDTGELRFFVLPPDALVGGMARADQIGR
jgi:hypothetical protein